MITLDIVTLVRNQVAAIQAMSNNMIDFAIGSILRAVVESNSTVALYLSGLILELLATARASTSSGTDLDTWMADYGVTRIPAVAATGVVTFARFTPAQLAAIPVGTTVETEDGNQQYTVVADALNVNFDTTSNSYLVPIDTVSIQVPVLATTPGTGANSTIGGINTLTQTVSGIDTVTNEASFTTGMDPESDTGLKDRFVEYIASLAKATKGAIGYAILSVQSSLQYILVENKNYDTTDNKGYFFAVIDDGTGSPSAGLLTAVGAAIEAVRPLCSTFGVFATVAVPASVTLTATIAAGYDAVAEKLLVKNAITDYINGLGLGKTLPYTIIAKLAYDASAGVSNVTSISVNGGVADIVATSLQSIKAGTITVN